LLARSDFNRGLYRETAERLDRALAKRLRPERVMREALRLRVVVACALGDVAWVKKAYEIWMRQDEPSTARKDAMARLVARCTE
jgi:hypothetical protein